MAEIKPSYLFAGDDDAKLDIAIRRLRSRAESEAGEGALESFPAKGSTGPDAEALMAAIPAMSLIGGHRYLLADGVEGWRPAVADQVGEALRSAPEDLTVVFVARGAAPKGLAEAVKAGGGETRDFGAPDKRELPAWVVSEARSRGIEIAIPAARAFVERVGTSTVRLGNELDRIAAWAGFGEGTRTVGADEVEELTADTSERAGWTLGDAVVSRDAAEAVVAADALLAQGENVTPLTYGVARRLRDAHAAALGLEAGEPARAVEARLPMAPYPAKMLVRSVRGTSSAELAEGIGAIADLEWWTRGGSEYDAEVALTLAIRRAAGA